MSRINESNLTRYTEKVKTYVNNAYPALTDAEIDNLWASTPGVDTSPDFTMTTGFVPMWNGATFIDGAALTDITDTSKIIETIQSQLVNFGYAAYTAGDRFAIKRNGYYMIYCNNAKLQLIETDANGLETQVISGAKQIALMASPITRKPEAVTFGAAGNYWTGDSISADFSGVKLPVEGFRTSLREGSYITCDEDFWVYQMVKGELATLKPLKILFIGNSHSQDTFIPLAEVFYAEGQTDYVFGLCKRDGSTIQDHVDLITGNVADYKYYESTPNSSGTYSNPFGREPDDSLTRVTMDTALKCHDWDYVFIQSSPIDLLDETVFAAQRQQVVNYIKEFVPNAKIGYSCSWLAPYSDSKDKLQSLTGGAKEWYDAIVTKCGEDTANQYRCLYGSAIENILTDNTYSIVTSLCTPVYYANQVLGVSSDILYRDVLHMSSLGRVLVGYTFYAQLMQAFGKIESLDTIKLDKYNIANYGLTEEYKSIITNSVNYTLQNPWAMLSESATQNS